MIPFSLRPSYKDYLWGGDTLKQEYGADTPLSIVAESWVLSAHPDGDSVIADGPLAGLSFAVFARTHRALLGAACVGFERFPILVKLIDAQKPLSIQVHPDDAYAQKVENEPGKTEMWVVLRHEPGAFLYCGFLRAPTKKEYEQRLRDGSITDVMERIFVQKGDVFLIRAGVLHAIGAGIVLAEIQENSNSTYRVHDFGRLDARGQPRPLHIEKALDVTRLSAGAPNPPVKTILCDPQQGCKLEMLSSCEHFVTERLTLRGTYERTLTGESFLGVLCTDGSGRLIAEDGALPLQKGRCLFVPADNPRITLTGQAECLLVSMPPL